MPRKLLLLRIHTVAANHGRPAKFGTHHCAQCVCVPAKVRVTVSLNPLLLFRYYESVPVSYP
jgi:hypothetical protein